MGSWKSSSQATAGTAACNDVIVVYFGAGNQDARICTIFPMGRLLRNLLDNSGTLYGTAADAEPHPKSLPGG
jgi:hypothetical protein